MPVYTYSAMETVQFNTSKQVLGATPSIQASLYQAISENPKQSQYFKVVVNEDGVLCKLLPPMQSYTMPPITYNKDIPEGDNQEPQENISDEIIICYPAHRASNEALAAWQEGSLLFIDKKLHILHPSDETTLPAAGTRHYATENEEEESKAAENPIDVFELLKILQNGSALKSIIPNFTPRKEQLEMLENVANAFNTQELSVVEAGTGTGKSFAYLFAALRYVSQNKNKRVVITTATITLQQQLIEKDIPIVQKALSTNIPVALVKGKRNYLCIRKFSDYLTSSFLSDTEHAMFMQWAEKTESGDRSEMPVFIPDDAWAEISSDYDTCFLQKCRNRDRCFIRKARERTMKTRVLVVNHHLLFSDLSIRAESEVARHLPLILPPVQHIIFDEAHSLEERITSIFSASTSVVQIQRLVYMLSSTKHGVIDWFKSCGVEKRIEREKKRLKKDLEALERVSVDYFTSDSAMLLLPGWQSEHGEFAKCVQETSETLQSLTNMLASFYEKYGKEEPEDSRREGILGKLLKRFASCQSLLHAFVTEQWDGQKVYWLEKVVNNSYGYIRFCLSPLRVTQIMSDLVLKYYETIVFCSASLRVGNSFDFWADALGLSDRKGSYSALPSPFMHQAQVLCLVPRDAPEPNSQQFQSYLSKLINQSINASTGGALILFTSYKSMKDCYATTQVSEDITLLMQGTDDRHQLLKKFRENKNSVLFATDSFWEGVDIPGDSLRLLVLCRLPFRHPSDPIRKSRHASIETAGGNPFAMDTLPTAVLRFKQGFGRLIRSEKDRGAVVIADVRMESKYYGRIFRESIPECNYTSCSTKETIEKLQRFFEE